MTGNVKKVSCKYPPKYIRKFKYAFLLLRAYIQIRVYFIAAAKDENRHLILSLRTKEDHGEWDMVKERSRV